MVSCHASFCPVVMGTHSSFLSFCTVHIFFRPSPSLFFNIDRIKREREHYCVSSFFPFFCLQIQSDQILRGIKNSRSGFKKNFGTNFYTIPNNDLVRMECVITGMGSCFVRQLFRLC